MFTGVINRELVVDTFTEIVQEKGEDYIYPAANTLYSCSYLNGIEYDYNNEDEPWVGTPNLDNASPSCIIGQFLHKIGFTFAEIVGPEAEWNTETSVTSLFEYFQEIGRPIRIDSFLMHVLENAQNAQDQGATWGAVLQGVKDELQ